MNSLRGDGAAAYILLAKENSLFGALGKQLLGRITGEDITDVLKKAGIRHDCKGLNTNIFAIKDLFAEGKLTQDGEDAVSYILMHNYKTMSEKQKEKVREIFERQLKNPKYRMDDLIIMRP